MEKINYLDIAKEIFDFNSLCKILTIMCHKCEDNNISIVSNDKNYNFEIKNTPLCTIMTISCSDGRKMSVEFDSSSKDIEVSHEIFDDTCLEFHIQCNSDMVYSIKNETCDENYLKDNITRTVFRIKDLYSSFDFFGTEGIGELVYGSAYVVFTKNGIEVLNKYLISNDCEKLISIDHKPASTLEDAEGFDFKEERRKYVAAISNGSLDLNYQQRLIDEYRHVAYEVKKYYDGIKDFYYKELPKYKKAVEFMNILTSNKLQDYMYNSDEMNMIIKELKELYAITEYDKENILKK